MSCRCPEGTFLTRSLRSASRPGLAVPHRIDGHDCAYVRSRNALIPIAARRAYGVATNARDIEWAVAYYAAMTTLAQERLGATA